VRSKLKGGAATATFFFAILTLRSLRLCERYLLNLTQLLAEKRFTQRRKGAKAAKKTVSAFNKRLLDYNRGRVKLNVEP